MGRRYFANKVTVLHGNILDDIVFGYVGGVRFPLIYDSELYEEIVSIRENEEKNTHYLDPNAMVLINDEEYVYYGHFAISLSISIKNLLVRRSDVKYNSLLINDTIDVMFPKKERYIYVKASAIKNITRSLFDCPSSWMKLLARPIEKNWIRKYEKDIRKIASLHDERDSNYSVLYKIFKEVKTYYSDLTNINALEKYKDCNGTNVINICNGVANKPYLQIVADELKKQGITNMIGGIQTCSNKGVTKISIEEIH